MLFSRITSKSSQVLRSSSLRRANGSLNLVLNLWCDSIAVGRNPENDRVGLAERAVQFAKILRFACAAAGVIAGIEVDHQVATARVR